MFQTVKALFDDKGSDKYMIGEPITQTQHALQSYFYMSRRNATDSLKLAALLHDIGHFVCPSLDPMETNDHHEYYGAKWLALAGFSPDVYVPIMLHVDAKRYLCTVDPNYIDTLSDASRISFHFQGGPMNETELKMFNQSKYKSDALLLRECDDNAKEITDVEFVFDTDEIKQLINSATRGNSTLHSGPSNAT